MLVLIAAAGVLHLTRPPEPAPGSDCEPISAGIAREPGNALSAAAIIAAGADILRRRRSVTFGSAVVTAGSASLLFHATTHPVAAAMDLVGAIWAVAAAGWLIRTRRPRPLAMIPAIAVFGAGAAIWIGSRTGAVWCFPDAAVHGHAVWHLAVAAAALLLARAADRHGTRPTP